MDLMMRLLVIAASVFLISAQPLLSAELTILTENLPNLNYVKDDVLVGPSVEIVREIQREEVYTLREIDLMIAFSKKTSDSILQKWRDAFNEMVADGTIARIHNKWNVE
jgi:ABC-type amino acid transport substrate-binding protein